MAADIAQGLLSDAIDLDLLVGWKVQFFIQRVVAREFVFELAIGRGMLNRVSQRKL